MNVFRGITAGDIRTVDYHTGGEPFRIVTSELPDIPGATVAARRVHASGDPAIDGIRQLLCYEPRGHADMYGCFLVPPNDDGAATGVLFWHKDGFSTACGHGTIALASWLVESGRIPTKPDGMTDIAIDVPSGRVLARVSYTAGTVESVAFRNVASYVVARSVTVNTGRGAVHADIAYGGAFYAYVSAQTVGLAVTPKHLLELTALGREVKWALNDSTYAQHPTDPSLSGIYGTIWYDDLGDTADGVHQRNVTIFADGEVDRSPCGSGTSARVALLADEGRLTPVRALTNESIVGSQFIARIVEETHTDGRPAVVADVEGTAHLTGRHAFVVDPRDALAEGFVLR